MKLLRSLRIYANRCPWCGERMRLYSWRTAPIELPALTTARICTLRHYMRTEHVPTGQIREFEEQGRPLEALAGVLAFPDPEAQDKPLHENLNVPLRKYAKPAPRPAEAPGKPAAAATAASGE